MTGEIKAIHADRGFGFIRVANYKDVFFHIKDAAIPEEDFSDQLRFRRVEFEVEADHSGRDRAVKVRLA